MRIFVLENICCGTHWMPLIEMLPISMHNICFHGWIRRVSDLKCLLSRVVLTQQMPSELEIDKQMTVY